MRVLVHDLGRTGVPVLLERLLRWADRERLGARIDVVALHGGALEAPVAARVRSLTVIEPSGRRSLADGAAVGLLLAGLPTVGDSVRRAHIRIRTSLLDKPDIVLIHGAGAWPLYDAAGHAPRVVLHLQELEVALSRSVPAHEVERFLGSMSAVMVVSAAVGHLAQGRGVPVDRLVEVGGTIDPDVHVDRTAARRATRSNGPTVAGSGTPGWRKGTDRFVALAHALGRSVPSAEAMWVGGRPSGADASVVGAPDPVRWHPACAAPWQLLAGADVFVVPSREDPLPLVALEAGQHGVAVVGQRGAGGLDDLLVDGRGLLVGAGDPEGLHDAVRDLLVDPDRAADLGAALAGWVAERYHPDRIGPAWWSAVTGES